MHRVIVPIEGDLPETWQELEAVVGRILTECGYDVEIHKNLKLARGEVDVDVWADDHSSPPNVIVVECKRWKTPVPKNVVHAFRAVVGDSGANTGLLVSAAGFQGGAVEAAKYSNVRLTSWQAFQEMFVERWYRAFMAPRLYADAGVLIDYTEPINTRISRKANALNTGALKEFEALRERYEVLAIGLIPLLMVKPGTKKSPTVPNLPLRASMTAEAMSHFTDDVLDAVALRPLMDALSHAYAVATAKFDEVFGERA